MDESNLKKIFELKQEINKLLKEKPELIPLQQKIDTVLKNSVHPGNRMTLIYTMMMDSFHELQCALEESIPILSSLGSKEKLDE